MESPPQGRCGEIASHLAIIFVTGVQLVFLTWFHRYIAWPTTAPDGSLAWLPMVTEDYFAWLPFPITASIVAIVASAAMIVYDRYWFHQGAWVVFCLLGLSVTLSLVSIFPFDFSVLPSAAAANVVPIVVKVFFSLMAVFYGVSAIALSLRLRRHLAAHRAG